MRWRHKEFPAGLVPAGADHRFVGDGPLAVLVVSGGELHPAGRLHVRRLGERCLDDLVLTRSELTTRY